MDLGIQGRVAIVGGASRGMGKAIAQGLAAEGVRVAMCARTQSALEEAANEVINSNSQEQVIAVAADLSSKDGPKHLFETVMNHWGTVDILVNNVGGPPPGKPSEHDDEAWSAAFELNFFSVVRMVRQVLPGMRDKSWGRIVNLLSIAVKEPVEGLVLSTASRMGAVGYAKMLADEIGPMGITVNNVLPGFVLTDRLRFLAETRAKAAGTTADEILLKMAEPAAARRIGRPDEMADLVSFLVSERAAYITGTSIVLDGGASHSTF